MNEKHNETENKTKMECNMSLKGKNVTYNKTNFLAHHVYAFGQIFYFEVCDIIMTSKRQN